MQFEALALAVTYDFSPESLCNLYADCDGYRYIPCAYVFTVIILLSLKKTAVSL